MSCRIFIENPPPFKRMPSGGRGAVVDIPMEQGFAIAEHYLAAGVRVSGFHHSDLDPFEAAQMRGRMVPERYDTFAYVRRLNERLSGFDGILAPHRVVVYNTPAEQLPAFRGLAEQGIKDVVVVGKPYSKHPHGDVYRCTVEEMLGYIRRRPELDLNLGVVGLHTRTGEPERLANKLEAAGGKLRVMGQFLDEVDSILVFMERLADEFEERKLDLGALEWNIGLGIYSLESRAFYAKLLRRNEVACERRFTKLRSTESRVNESVKMNLEFAEQILQKGREFRLNLGFSIQPIMERRTDGSMHTAVHGAVDLAKAIQGLCP
jgi:hypothetical protein